MYCILYIDNDNEIFVFCPAGEWPNIAIEVMDPSVIVSANVSLTTPGVAAFSNILLQYDGYWAPVIPRTPTADQVCILNYINFTYF